MYIYIPAQNSFSSQSHTSTWQPFSSRGPGPDDKVKIIWGYDHSQLTGLAHQPSEDGLVKSGYLAVGLVIVCRDSYIDCAIEK